MKGEIFMLYNYLQENYRPGEPIFLRDIAIDGMSEPNIRYHLKQLTDQGILNRFEAGTYYFPKANIFGEKMAITADTVALYKYIYRRGRYVGYYSGYTLANRMGLSTQVPYTQEIISNYAPAQVREIKIKNHKYILRKPVVKVNDENVATLQFLDCLKDLDKCAEEDPKICGRILTDYARKHKITKSFVDRYLYLYPLKIYKAIYDTGVDYVSS